MANDAESVTAGLLADGGAAAESAFKQACGNVESIAKDLCPIGHYGRSRGKGGKVGGDLKQSLRVEYLGRSGTQLLARCVSGLPYAGVQHDEELHHPGKYTGAPGKKYRARFFERGVEIIFGSGADPLGDPGAQLGALPAGFQELLNG